MKTSIVLSAVVLGLCFAAGSSAIAAGRGGHGGHSGGHGGHGGHSGHGGHGGHQGHGKTHSGNVYVRPNIYVAPVVTESPWQNVRYLRVNNQSGVTLNVFVQLTPDSPAYTWTIEPGAMTFLAIDGERIAAAQVCLWAQSGDRNWSSNRNGLTLVSDPYQSDEVGVFTYTFNP